MKNPQITPPYLRMAVYHRLELCRHFLWQFRRTAPDGKILLYKCRDGRITTSYPIIVRWLLDLLAAIAFRLLSKYWRYWVDIQFKETPEDVLYFICAECPSCKQILICFDGDTIVCACQETEHSTELKYSERTKAALRRRARYRWLEGDLNPEL
jgi:hypothetical protein